MFQSLSQNISNIINKLKGKGVVTESDIDVTMREVRIALLEADVSLDVVRALVNNIKTKALGQEILKSLTPAQMIIKIIHEELLAILTIDENQHLIDLPLKRNNNIVMVGLQASGKTTSSAKLALYLKRKLNKNVLLVSLDIYRPAARQQLAILAEQMKIDSLEIIENESVDQILKRAAQFCQRHSYDVVIYDTAGRLHIDNSMMQELKEIKQFLNPSETILVVDSLMGQDAANVAKEFNDNFDITGSIVSRIDGDQRGGAVLTIRHVTTKPIKFMAVGEKLEDFEPFQPERIVSRILDMGDVLSLVEKAELAMDDDEAKKAQERLKKGAFDLNDYISYLKTMNKMGGFANIMSMIPGANKIKQQLGEDGLNKGGAALAKHVAIINSMTKLERAKPEILKASRKRRIANGCGLEVFEVNILLKQFEQMRAMIKQFSSGSKSFMREIMGKFF